MALFNSFFPIIFFKTLFYGNIFFSGYYSLCHQDLHHHHTCFVCFFSVLFFSLFWKNGARTQLHNETMLVRPSLSGGWTGMNGQQNVLGIHKQWARALHVCACVDEAMRLLKPRASAATLSSDCLTCPNCSIKIKRR